MYIYIFAPPHSQTPTLHIPNNYKRSLTATSPFPLPLHLPLLTRSLIRTPHPLRSFKAEPRKLPLRTLRIDARGVPRAIQGRRRASRDNRCGRGCGGWRYAGRVVLFGGDIRAGSECPGCRGRGCGGLRRALGGGRRAGAVVLFRGDVRSHGRG